MNLLRLALIVAALGGALVAFAPAAADRVYHTERLELVPIADAPLRSGFVVNNHPNGPQVFANERYVLNGAVPHTTYQVILLIFPGDPICAGEGIPIPTATLTTNAAGNGEAQARFVPADVPPDLHGQTIGGTWQVTSGGEVVYATACTAITLD